MDEELFIGKRSRKETERGERLHKDRITERKRGERDMREDIKRRRGKLER